MEAALCGKAILVTGSTQGVGEAIARHCIKAQAAAVTITGRNAERGQALCDELSQSTTKVDFVQADLSQSGAEDALFDAALAGMGGMDTLVNSAGLTDRGSLAAATRDTWQRLLRVNAEAPFFLMQRLVNYLREQGKGGTIVNILSMNVYVGSADLAVYAATKAAMALLTKNAAQAHRFDQIRINGINMGWADTPAERRMQSETLGKGDDWLEKAASEQPFGRLLNADDVARLALFLISNASEPMTGALIDQEQWVNGGRDETRENK